MTFFPNNSLKLITTSLAAVLAMAASSFAQSYDKKTEKSITYITRKAKPVQLGDNLRGGVSLKKAEELGGLDYTATGTVHKEVVGHDATKAPNYTKRKKEDDSWLSGVKKRAGSLGGLFGG